MVGVESSLPLVSRLDVYIVKTPADVQFSEVLSSAELWHKFRDEGQKISVLYHYWVESPVVLHQLERTVLFLDKEYWGSHRWLGWAYLSSIQIFLWKSIQLLLLNGEEGIDLCRLGLRTWKELYCIILMAMFWQDIKIILGKHGFKASGIRG